jgi:antitoxin component YwqK of YwqJK toxin-antitoxin module
MQAEKLQKMKLLIRIALIILIFSVASCKGTRHGADRIENWYVKIKNEILSHSRQRADSIFYEKEGQSLHLTYFSKGKKLREEYRSFDTARIHFIKYYGPNELFELRSEIHRNGKKATEGITYNGNYYGPWTVWYDNGQIMYRGYRYENEDFGNWIYYKENGKVDKMIDHSKPFLSDSILHKSSLHTTAAL